MREEAPLTIDEIAARVLDHADEIEVLAGTLGAPDGARQRAAGDAIDVQREQRDRNGGTGKKGDGAWPLAAPQHKRAGGEREHFDAEADVQPQQVAGDEAEEERARRLPRVAEQHVRADGRDGY